MTSTQIDEALDRVAGTQLAQARLRLCLRLLSQAAEADPRLFETDDWKCALADVAKLLGEKSEVQGQKRNPERIGTSSKL